MNILPGTKIYIPENKEANKYRHGSIGAFVKCDDMKGYVTASHVFPVCDDFPQEVLISGDPFPIVISENEAMILRQGKAVPLYNDKIIFREICSPVETNNYFSGIAKPKKKMIVHRISDGIVVSGEITEVKGGMCFVKPLNSTTELSTSGDSGSPWFQIGAFTKNSQPIRHLLGFHIAGNDENKNPDSEFGVFCVAQDNLKELGLDLLTIDL
jgi:hypothetical protein